MGHFDKLLRILFSLPCIIQGLAHDLPIQMTGAICPPPPLLPQVGVVYCTVYY